MGFAAAAISFTHFMFQGDVRIVVVGFICDCSGMIVYASPLAAMVRKLEKLTIPSSVNLYGAQTVTVRYLHYRREIYSRIYYFFFMLQVLNSYNLKLRPGTQLYLRWNLRFQLKHIILMSLV